jgi:TatD family-associated radical SAM protein
MADHTSHPMASSADVFGYTIGDRRYLNVTNRCTLRCQFCPKFNGTWTVCDHTLRLSREPSVQEIIEAAGNPKDYSEIVFCGLGEPTLRLYDVLTAAGALRVRGGVIRINTDGLANLMYGRDVTPDFEGIVDALAISMNAQSADVYETHCRPKMPGCYEAMLDFVQGARHYVPDVVVTAIDGLEGVDIVACKRLAQQLGVRFRRRVLDEVGTRGSPDA